MMDGMRIPLLVALPVAALLVAGCGASHHSTPHTAAEPAVAQALSVTPAGTVVKIGAAPQGTVHDASTGLVAVAVHSPDRLLLIDGTTLAVRRSVALPGHARHLQLAGPGGPVLVPAEDADELVTVDLSTGATVATKVGTSPHDAAETSDGRIVVGDEFGRSLTVIKDGRVERTITQVEQPGGVIADGTQVAIVDVKAYSVSTFDPATGKRTAIVDAGLGPTHGALVGPNRLAVADTRGNAILLFSLSPLRQIARLALAGSPYGIATDPTTDSVWITLTGPNQVVGLDASGDRLHEIARYPSVEQPDTLAVAPGSHTLWVSGTKAGVLERITR